MIWDMEEEIMGRSEECGMIIFLIYVASLHRGAFVMSPVRSSGKP